MKEKLNKLEKQGYLYFKDFRKASEISNKCNNNFVGIITESFYYAPTLDNIYTWSLILKIETYFFKINNKIYKTRSPYRFRELAYNIKY